MEKFEDDFDEFDDEGESRASRFAPIVVVLLALLAVGGLGWYAFHSADQETDVAGVPTIRADNDAIREKPADEGGMEIPHRDREIYDSFSAPATKGENATVKNTVEEPVKRERIAEKSRQAAEKAAEPKKVERLLDDEDTAPVPSAAVVSDEPAPAPVAGAIPAPAESAAVQEAGSETPAAVTETQTAPARAAETAQTKSATPPPGVRVQLGAFRSEAEAVESWKKILGKNKDVLANKVFTVRKADLGDKGIYYRLQVGSFATADEARQTCKTLNDRKLGCFVAK